MTSLNPYRCLNTAATVTQYPTLSNLNRLLGCLDIDDQGIPASCPAYLCENGCPESCFSDVAADMPSLLACIETQSKTPHLYACSPFYVEQIRYAMYLASIQNVAYSSTDTVRPFSFSGSGEPGPEDVAILNYLNSVFYCVSHTCGCPSMTPSGQPTLACSGHGECHLGTDETEGYCVCETGFEGSACGVTDGCALGYNFKTGNESLCGGGEQGVCNKTTNQCECLNGWTGAECTERTCPTVEGKLCGGNGTCSSTNTCVCAEGYMGPACNCASDGTCGEIDNPYHNGSKDGSVTVDNGSAGIPADVHEMIWVAAAVLIVVVICFALFTGSSKHYERHMRHAMHMGYAMYQ